MSFNASMSRSLVFKKGIALEKERFKLSSEIIPTIQEKSIKSLGKPTDHSQRDTVAIQETKVNLEKWLIKVDKSRLPGRFEAWIYNHTILPQNTLASINEFTIAHIEQILFTNPSARAGFDTRSIFKRSLTGLNSEFSFS